MAANDDPSGADAATPLAGDAADTALFPGQNPHPVMRVRDGRLAYANPASATVVGELGLALNEPVAAGWLERFERAAGATPPEPIEISIGVRTMSLLVVRVPEHGFLNIYGTDVTAAKVVERFPDRNPVLRMTSDGRLAYANRASDPITAALGIVIGDALPTDLRDAIRTARSSGDPIEVDGDGRTFILRPVEIPEFDFINLYGTDVTAARALNRFPDQNPNPVLRIARDGRLEYANPASAPVCRGLAIAVGEPVPDDLLARIRALAAQDDAGALEVESDGRVFSVLVVALFEYGSINLYGTDITAAREVERANRENERLLLNILPASIAARLRSGEQVIADRFDEMTVLFADIVDFTRWAAAADAGAVVAVLNEVFSLFDGLAERHELEKIKTIGDAYMVVGGINPGERHGPEHVAAMALDLLAELERYRSAGGSEIHVRIGIASGPVVAGVIGLKKFIYDVWGDTVNLASRLESTGVADRIQVSAELVRRLDGRFAVERRGIVDLKGRGPTETFFLTGRVGDARIR